jgi:hypothetical protein
MSSVVNPDPSHNTTGDGKALRDAALKLLRLRRADQLETARRACPVAVPLNSQRRVHAVAHLAILRRD